MKIICVGRNYPAHARELNNPVPEAPVIFMKPESALLPPGADLYYPDFSSDLHYECELVIRINRHGKAIPLDVAPQYFSEWTAGLDFTARDLQSDLKKKGLPWELAKAFDGSAAIGSWHPAGDGGRFSLYRNEEKVQDGFSGDMLFSLPYLIHFVSRYFSLEPGDLLFSGTPAGVGPVQPGDRLVACLNERPCLDLMVREPA